MPLVDIHVLEGVFTEDEKHRLITETAKVFGAVAGEHMQKNVSVIVHEVKSGLWGGADGVWTTERALAMRAGKES